MSFKYIHLRVLNLIPQNCSTLAFLPPPNIQAFASALFPQCAFSLCPHQFQSYLTHLHQALS